MNLHFFKERTSHMHRTVLKYLICGNPFNEELVPIFGKIFIVMNHFYLKCLFLIFLVNEASTMKNYVEILSDVDKL